MEEQMNTEKFEICEYWGEETGLICILRITYPNLSRPNGEGLNDGYLMLLYV